MTVRRGRAETGGTGSEDSPAELAPLREDHGWLRAAEQEMDLDDDLPRTTKVGKVRRVKVRTVPGARRRRADD